MVDSSDADKSLQKTDKNVEDVGKKFLKGVGTVAKWGVALGAAAGVGAAALFGVATKAAAAGDRIDKLSQKIGLSRKGFQEMDFIASQSGMSVEVLQSGFKKLSGTMVDASEGNKLATKAFKDLGVSAEDSTGKLKSQEQMFNETIVALQNMEEGPKKAALANDLLGKSASELAPLINGAAGSVEEMRKKANDLGLVLSDETIDASVKFTDSVDQVKRSLGAVVTNIGASVMPMFQTMLEWITANLPQIKNVFQTVFDVIGSLVKGVGGFITNTLIPALTRFYEWIAPNIPLIKETIKTAFDAIKEAIDILVDALVVLWDGFVKISTWISENQTLVENIAIVVGSFAVAWGLVNAAIFIWNAIAVVAATVTTAFGVAVAFLTSPIFLVTLAIAAIIAIGILLYKNWDTIKAKLIQFKDAIVSKFEEIKSNVVNKVTQLKDGVVNKFNEIKTSVTNKVEEIKSGVINKFNSIKDGAATAFNNVKNAVLNPINTLKDKISDIVDKIKGFFTGLDIKIPKIKMPHFSLKGTFSLLPPQVPKLAVDWYEKGGVFNKATQIGVGENGREVVMPLEKNTGWIDELANKIFSRSTNTNINNDKSSQTTIINLDGKQIARVTTPFADKISGSNINLMNRGLLV